MGASSTGGAWLLIPLLCARQILTVPVTQRTLLTSVLLAVWTAVHSSSGEQISHHVRMIRMSSVYRNLLSFYLQQCAGRMPTRPISTPATFSGPIGGVYRLLLLDKSRQWALHTSPDKSDVATYHMYTKRPKTHKKCGWLALREA